MKLLLLHTHDYWLKPYKKNLENADTNVAAISCRNAVVALIHVEAADEESQNSIITKSIKNIKWHARKVDCEIVVLHSFAHLATTRADPETAQHIIQQIAGRLAAVGFTVEITPFGYFNEFKMHVAGPSIAKTFVDI
ncbi:MAG: threonyl-tRNA synthetase editing domain-containing protein [bacterium]